MMPNHCRTTGLGVVGELLVWTGAVTFFVELGFRVAALDGDDDGINGNLRMGGSALEMCQTMVQRFCIVGRQE
ncbi:hypothetical protein PG994_008773 [Apiospora phragmitis]|uniref:Uncharacterized protein n=1 Tax=Apiospora phragmitis TaxID=2905665 RepID=A0ABR1UJU3_9PEZI